MATRKEEKDRLRAAREQAEAAERSSERKRLILGYAVAGIITVAVLAGIVFAIVGGDGDSQGTIEVGENERVNQEFGSVPDDQKIDDRDSVEPPSDGADKALEVAAADAGCELALEQKDEGNRHISGNKAPKYEANPPTSGDHSPNPLADGAYETSPNPLHYIHALEHGRIEIQYSSDLPEDAQLELLGLYDEDRPGMIVFPNDDMPFEVAATAWRQTLGCDSYEGVATLDAIRAFKAAYRARGPEPIPLG